MNTAQQAMALSSSKSYCICRRNFLVVDQIQISPRAFYYAPQCLRTDQGITSLAVLWVIIDLGDRRREYFVKSRKDQERYRQNITKMYISDKLRIHPEIFDWFSSPGRMFVTDA